MISKQEKLIESITSRILLFCRQNRAGSKINRNNGAISAEDFFLGLMNILGKSEGSNFINANSLQHNHPGVDLIDFDNKKAIQVTVENSLRKIKKSFNSIPAKSNNNDYSKVIFIIQADDLTAGIKKINTYNGYDVEVLSILDILEKISQLNDFEHIEQICGYVEKTIDTPEKVLFEKQVDDEAFGILFNSLKNELENSDILQKAEKEYIYKSSSSLKKEKFKKDWKALKEIYLLSLGGANEDLSKKIISYERQVKEAFSQDIDEVQKNRILTYLNLESSIILMNNQGNPIQAVNELVEKMQKDFKVNFLSKCQIMSFIMYMFFSCDVFPIILNENE